MMLAATVCAALLVLRGPDRALVAALSALFGTALAWMLVSIFWPAKPDRTCPACQGMTLRRLDSRSTRGIVCDACGHEDAVASSFLLAEDENTPIEPLVIAERDGVIAERAGVIEERAGEIDERIGRRGRAR
jgi:hypothetical protein